MEPSLYKYILKHSKKDQLALVLLSVVSLPLVYITLELPNKIIIRLEGVDIPEGFLGEELDKRNFRKKIITLDQIEETGEKRESVRHRPARLYRVKDPQDVTQT